MRRKATTLETLGKMFQAPTDCHWYKADGSPFHKVPYKDKKREGELRDVTLSDAKKHDAWRSVTTIIDLVNKPHLNAWSKNQVIYAIHNNPRMSHETDLEHEARLVKAADKYRDESSEWGSQIHDAIHLSAMGQPVEFMFQPYVQAVRAALARKGFTLEDAQTEISFCCSKGFGGTIDLLYRPMAILDIKTKKKPFEKGQKLAYDNHCMQLAAYRWAACTPEADCYNVFVDIDAEVRLHKWEEKDLQWNLKRFRHLLAYSLVTDKREPEFVSNNIRTQWHT
jgi:hypothetical protein